MMRLRTWLLMGCLTAAAQALPPEDVAVPVADLQPVDQAVGDLDVLSRSLRVMEPGIRSDGEQTSLFMSPAGLEPDGSPRQASYYRIGPGFRARVDRADYLIPVAKKKKKWLFQRNITPVWDGWFIERVPADTVYELAPLPASPPPPAQQLPDNDRRVTGLLDGRISAQVDGRIDGRVGR